jgi:hypothetical protein
MGIGAGRGVFQPGLRQTFEFPPRARWSADPQTENMAPWQYADVNNFENKQGRLTRGDSNGRYD